MQKHQKLSKNREKDPDYGIFNTEFQTLTKKNQFFARIICKCQNFFVTL